MEIAAHFEFRPHDDDGGEGVLVPRNPRRTLRLEAVGETAGGHTAVTIHNISSTGLLLETTVALAEGEAIDVDLPHNGRTRAHVIWASGAFHGCAFDTPITRAALSAAQLRAGAATAEAANATPTPSVDVGDPSLGSRIQRLRKERQMTLSDLALRMGVSKPTVWAWEQGKAKPVESRFATLAEALGVSLADLRPSVSNAAGQDVIARARRQIAAAYRTQEERVRIMIEL